MNDETVSGSTGPEPTAPAICPLCGVPLPSAVGPTAVDQHGRPVAFRHCQRCHSLVPDRTADSPIESAIVALIDAEPDVEPDLDIDLDIDADGPDRARQLVDRIDAGSAALAWTLAEFLPAPGHLDAVVDLGAGRGGTLQALRALGYEVQGCEPSAFLCQMARAAHLIGPDVLVNADPDAFLDRLEAEATHPSALILWHVLDRHPDPTSLLARCRRLAPGATLFIEFPVADPGRLLAEQRFWPTPATLSWLADEHDLTIVRASLDENEDLRLFARLPDPDVVDLDPARRHSIDVPALEAAYRGRSPIFAHLVPDPEDEALDMLGAADPADRDTASEADTEVGSRF